MNTDNNRFHIRKKTKHKINLIIKNYRRKKRGAAREYCDGHVTSVTIDITVHSVLQELGAAPRSEQVKPGSTATVGLARGKVRRQKDVTVQSAAER
jgi:hypothetical protein